MESKTKEQLQELVQKLMKENQELNEIHTEYSKILEDRFGRSNTLQEKKLLFQMKDLKTHQEYQKFIKSVNSNIAKIQNEFDSVVATNKNLSKENAHLKKNTTNKMNIVFETEPEKIKNLQGQIDSLNSEIGVRDQVIHDRNQSIEQLKMDIQDSESKQEEIKNKLYQLLLHLQDQLDDSSTQSISKDQIQNFLKSYQQLTESANQQRRREQEARRLLEQQRLLQMQNQNKKPQEQQILRSRSSLRGFDGKYYEQEEYQAKFGLNSKELNKKNRNLNQQLIKQKTIKNANQGSMTMKKKKVDSNLKGKQTKSETNFKKTVKPSSVGGYYSYKQNLLNK